MSRSAVRLGIAGLGTVSQGLLALLYENKSRIEKQLGRSINVVRVASRTRRETVDILGAEFSTNLESLISDDIDIVVELIGGTADAHALIQNALEKGKSVVTANKAVLADYGNNYIKIADEKHVSLGIEASVAGGIPAVAAIKNGLAGNTLSSVAGIINGTCNYILTAMDREGTAFEDALKDAQDLGYAEMDPSFDVDGIDAAQKLAILVSISFDQPIVFDDIYIEGISEIDVEDLNYAREFGYRIKHIALGQVTDGGVEMRVHPALVPESHLLASVDGVENAIAVSGNGVGSLMMTGPGAGARPTASAVLSDIIEIANGTSSLLASTQNGLASKPIAEIESCYYLNIPVSDVPGVIALIGDTLAQHNVSIEAVIQRSDAVRETDGARWVPVVLITNKVLESVMEATLADLGDLSPVQGQIRRIRIAELN